MPKLVPGVNDLATLHPHLVAEADGWDPSTLVAGTNKEMLWIMARDKVIDEKILSQIYQRLKNKGFDTTRIKRMKFN